MFNKTAHRMIYFCTFLFVFLFVRLLIAAVNYFSFRYLPESTEMDNAPRVSVLIPARNEEKNIGNLLKQLGEFSYNGLEIIVYDDNSNDNTTEIIKEHSQHISNITLITGNGLVNGWLGKNYACHRLAAAANGEIFLFLDADVSVQNGLLERSINYFVKHNLHLLSIFPKQILKSTGEKISVPIMNWILLSFLPLIFIKSSKNPAFAAANGQFMMFRADTYKEILPHQIFRAHKVEDIAIITYFKQKGLQSDTLLGDDSITCRMYTGLKEAIEGFSKNIFQFFGNSILITVLVGLITTIAPFIVFLYLGLIAGAIYLIGILLIRIFVSLASKQLVFENCVNLIPQHLIFLFIISKGIVNYKKKKLIWKGRNIMQDK